jgi:hypothetical protein
MSCESARLSVSQPVCYQLPILAICFSAIALAPALGQKTSNSPGTATSTKICEGSLPRQTSLQQPPPDTQSATEGDANRLKLSTRAGQESSEPEGPFCRREHSGQDSLQPSAKPSVKSDQPDAASEPMQPVPASPIAQLTDGKLTIKASGQDFTSVLESVRSVTGFTIEKPSSADSEPVFLSVGPTSVADALVALLSGTNYNYIIVGSEQDSQAVKRLILTDRTGSAPATLVASSQGQTLASQSTLYGGQADTETEAAEPPPPPPPLPINPAAIPSSVPTGINVQKLAAESGKTVGQVLEELQKRQIQVLDEQAASQSQSAPQQ